MAKEELKPGYFNSLRAHYELSIGPQDAPSDCLVALVSSLKNSIEQEPNYRVKPEVKVNWSGESFRGRKITFYDPRRTNPTLDFRIYTTLELDNSERRFFVVDSSRHTFTREHICNKLDKLDMVHPMNSE